MEITELLEGKATEIKGKEYPATKEIVQPFIDAVTPFTDDFRIKAVAPQQITIGDEKDQTYNRVLIEAVFPNSFDVDDHQLCVGFIYGLDVRKPIAKIYRGRINSACTNLSVFSPDDLVVSKVSNIDYTNVKRLAEHTDDFAVTIKALKEQYIEQEKVHEKLGKMVDLSMTYAYETNHGKFRLPPKWILDAYRNVYIESNNPYYVKAPQESSLFNFYNAVTQSITDDKDILNRYEKTLVVNMIVNGVLEQD